MLKNLKMNIVLYPFFSQHLWAFFDFKIPDKMKKSQDVTSQPHKKMLIDQESTLFVMENSELSFRNETICSHYSTFLNYQVPDTRVNVCTFFY